MGQKQAIIKRFENDAFFNRCTFLLDLSQMVPRFTLFGDEGYDKDKGDLPKLPTYSIQAPLHRKLCSEGLVGRHGSTIPFFQEISLGQ